MFRSRISWFWRKIVDCFAFVGILAFLVNVSLSGKAFSETNSGSPKSLTGKLFERFIDLCSGCIFNLVFGTMHFNRELSSKFWHCLQWLRQVFIQLPLTSFAVLYSWADDIYTLFWFKIIQLLFTLIEGVKSDVIFRIGKANLAMIAFTSTIAEIHREYHFYHIPSFVMMIKSFKVIGACLKLIRSLVVLIALTITEFCFGVTFDSIHKPCSASKNQCRLNYLKNEN